MSDKKTQDDILNEAKASGIILSYGDDDTSAASDSQVSDNTDNTNADDSLSGVDSSDLEQALSNMTSQTPDLTNLTDLIDDPDDANDSDDTNNTSESPAAKTAPAPKESKKPATKNKKPIKAQAKTPAKPVKNNTKPNIKPQAKAPAKPATNLSSELKTVQITINDQDSGNKQIKTISANEINMRDSIADLLDAWINNGYELVTDLTKLDAYKAGKAVVNVKHSKKDVSRSKTVTETIQYSTSDNTPAPEDAVQTIDFKQTGIQDLVTGQINYAKADLTKTFKAVKTPNLPGYKPDLDSVNSISVTVDPDNFNVNQDVSRIVNYIAELQKIRIDFVDQDQNKAVIKSVPLTGFTNQAANFDLDSALSELTKKNYKLAKSGVPDNLTFKPEKQHYQVLVKHSFKVLTMDDSTNPLNSEDLKKNLFHDVTRTINRHMPSKDLKPLVQTARFTRKAKLDLVTGKIKYGAYSKPTVLPSIQIKTVPGYTAKPDSVSELKVAADNANTSVDVKFSPVKQSILLQFVDHDDSHILRKKELTGHTDEVATYNPASDISDLTVKHYNLVENPLAKQKSLVFKPEEQVIEFVFNHKTTELNADNSVNPTTGEDEKDKLVKTLTRTIDFDVPKPALSPDSITQLATFERKATLDLVTGKLEFGPWSAPETFKALSVPKVTGFKPDQESINEVVVSGNDSNIKTTITYAATTQTINITFRDQDEVKILANEPFTGLTNQPIDFDINELVKTIEKRGYKALPYNFNYKTYPAENKSITINFKHRVTHLTLDKLKSMPDSEIEAIGQNRKYLASLLAVSYTYTLSFVDKANNDLQKPFTITQNLERQAWFDHATKKMRYSKYEKTNRFPKTISLTPISGLVPMHDKVSVPDLAVLRRDMYGTALYLAPTQTVKVDFVDSDKDNKPVASFNLDFNLHSDKTVELKALLARVTKKGYELAKIDKNNNLPAVLSYSKALDDQRQVTIYVKELFDEHYETKKVTRTILVTNPDSSSRKIEQIAYLKRLVHTGKATNTVVKDDWSTNIWDAFVPAQITGYTANQHGLGETIVNSETKDQTIKLNYIALPKGAVNNKQEEVPADTQAARSRVNTRATHKPEKLNWFQKLFGIKPKHTSTPLALDAPDDKKKQK